MAKKVLITDTILRDAHQSQAATRMRLDEMLPVAEKLDKVGYYSLECWGGATFDACLRFLNEDPWERLRALRKAMPNTKLQMLLRGQNLLGYKHYDDDLVDRFIQKSIENGIDIIRIFDALNDIRNLQPLPEDLSLPLSMTLEAHTGGKGQKPFFFPFIQRKIKGEHARTAIKGERGHEKTTARFVCRRREGNLLCLVIFLYVV